MNDKSSLSLSFQINKTEVINTSDGVVRIEHDDVKKGINKVTGTCWNKIKRCYVTLRARESKKFLNIKIV